jgi:hypothetical protein
MLYGMYVRVYAINSKKKIPNFFLKLMKLFQFKKKIPFSTVYRWPICYSYSLRSVGTVTVQYGTVLLVPYCRNWLL